MVQEKNSEKWTDKALINEFQKKHQIITGFNEDIKFMQKNKHRINSYIIGLTYFDDNGEIVSEYITNGDKYYKLGLGTYIYEFVKKAFLGNGEVEID